MIDIVDSQTRSRMMAGIRGRDTKPELLLRRGLQQLGFRHRLGNKYLCHGRLLPGKPDLVYPKYMAVIQVNGCFWHKHDCHLFKWPATRRAFWQKKIGTTAIRDQQNEEALEHIGWRVLTVWECALKGKTHRNLSEVIHTAASWIQYGASSAELEGYLDF